jgi:hypothetical protein
MAKRRIQLIAINLALGIAPAFAGDELPALTPEQISRVGEVSCRLWHDRGAEKAWDDPNPPVNVPADARAVVVICDAHETFRDSPVKGVARCHGQDLQWTCIDNGLELTYRLDGIEHQMLLVETSVKTGGEIVDHLRQQLHHGKHWAKFAIDQVLLIHPFGDDGETYWMRYEWMDQDKHGWESVIEVRRRCSANKCRYRSKYLTGYPTYKDL